MLTTAIGRWRIYFLLRLATADCSRPAPLFVPCRPVRKEGCSEHGPRTLLCAFPMASVNKLFYPGNVPIHPALQELPAVRPDITRIIKQAILYMNKCFRLAKGRHIQVSQHIAQMLLRHGSPNRADGSAKYTGRLARPGVLPIRTRCVI